MPTIPLFPQALDGWSHLLACPQSLKCLLVDLGTLLTESDDLIEEGKRHDHHAIRVPDEDIAWVDPQIALELQRNIDLACFGECIRTKDGDSARKDLERI